MGDIKTEPEDSICYGCLSRHRKLSPLSLLAMYDLYWSLLTEDQKIESLAIPQIAMCWECTATLRRTWKFQLQVQKALTLLQDCSELSPTKETLSPLSVQHKDGYDAIFRGNTLVKQPTTRVNIPIINVKSYKKNSERKGDLGDIGNIKKTEMDNVKASSYNITSEQHSDDECKIEKPSDYIGDDDLETDNLLCTSAEQNLPKTSKPRSSLRRAALRSSQIVDKPSPKDGKRKRDVVRPPIQFVSPPKTETLLPKLDEIEDKKIEVVEDKTESVPLVKTHEIAQLKMQPQNLLKTPNNSTVKIDRQKNGSQTNKSDEKINKVSDIFQSEFSYDDDFTDTDSDDDFDDRFGSQQNEEIKTKPFPLVEDSAISELSLSDVEIKEDDASDDSKPTRRKRVRKERPASDPDFSPNEKYESELNLSDVEIKEADDSGDGKLTRRKRVRKERPASDPDFSRNEKYESELNLSDVEIKEADDSGDGKLTRRKRVRKERPASDPDFSPNEKYESKEKITNVNGESKFSRNKTRKYKKVIVQYNTIEDVLPHFTQIEMTEQEYTSILQEEDAIVDDKKPQKCFECGMCFQRWRTLAHHAKYTHQIHDYRMVKKPTVSVPPVPCLWRCAACGRGLRAQHALAHMRLQHRRQYSCAAGGCEWSPNIFWEKEDLLSHWEAIHKQCECEECGRRVRGRSAMDWHIREAHTAALSIPCPACPRQFASRAQLARHARRHAPPAPRELRYCVECDVTFPSVHRYSCHVHTVHTPRHRWPCEECGKELVSKAALERHVTVRHGDGVTKFQCEICGKYLAKRLTLEQHVLRHKNLHVRPPSNKPCSVCGRKFQSNRTLRHHMYTHTGQRPYACTRCAAAYTQPYCLRVHLARAHGIHQAVPERVPPADPAIF